jgi:hypothetical protein
MEVIGLPLHPLMVHGAVVFVPLMLVFAVLMFVPRISRSMTVLAGATGITAALFVAAARITGEDLRRTEGTTTEIVRHENLAEPILPLVLAPAVVLAILALLELGWPRGAARLQEKAAAASWALPAIRVFSVMLAVASVFQVVLIGASGAAAVWGPQPE